MILISKDKANELFNMFYKHTWQIHTSTLKYKKQSMSKSAAIWCAIQLVNELIKASPSLPILSDNGNFSSDILESKVYWEDVKKELNKI
jgi:hypothetical protein